MNTITKKESFLLQKRKSMLKDIELISMNLTAEYMGIYIEHQLFIEISIDSKITII